MAGTDTTLFNCVQKLQAVCIFTADIVSTDEPLYASLRCRSGRGLEPDRTGPVFSYERVLAAAALYRINPRLKLIPSGGFTNREDQQGTTISAVVAFELEQLGVPRSAIIEEPLASSTQEQVVNCAAVSREKEWSADRIAILAPSWQFERIVAFLIVTRDIEPFALGITRCLPMERALINEDPIWEGLFAEWYAIPAVREMMMKDALGAVQLLTGYHPVYGVKPFRGFPDPLAS